MLYLDQPALKTIEHQVQQMSGGISFAQGALRIGGVHPSIREYAQTVLNTDKADYYVHSLGIKDLRQKLADTLSARYATKIGFDNVIVTHGSINGIAALCLLLLNNGDEVVVPEPTYSAFRNTIAIAKGKIKFVSTYRHKMAPNGGLQWVFDFESLKAACTDQTKMVLITHPSNPTGACMSQEELTQIANFCENKGIYCIFDEAYENYFFDGPSSSGTPLVAHSHYIIRTGSFSKTFGMSGWRVGYVVAPKRIIDQIAAVQDGLIVCPNVIGQYAALHALEHPEISATYTEYMRKNRALTYQALQPLVDAGILVCPQSSGGFYLFVQTKHEDCTDMVYDMLAKAHVAVVPGKDFGPSGKGCFRLCYARRTDLLEEGLNRLVAYFKK